MTWGMKARRFYIFYKMWLILVAVVALACPPIVLLQAYGTYREAEYIKAKADKLIAETRPVHERVIAYDTRKTNLLGYTKNEIHTDILLYHILVEAGSVEPMDKVLLDSIQFTEDEFTIKGHCASPDAGHRYIQRLKIAIKGVTITDKQGIDAAGQMAAFEVQGSFKGTKNKS